MGKSHQKKKSVSKAKNKVKEPPQNREFPSTQILENTIQQLRSGKIIFSDKIRKVVFVFLVDRVSLLHSVV